jgi:methionine--tRNA ligase beta chain
MTEETKTEVSEELKQETEDTPITEEVKPVGKAMITYADFVKLDITIGTIVSVEIVEGADKLLKLEVDVQEEKPRQIISGIREYFEDVQFLVGKQCPFLTNLESRTIRGYESQGMILASEHDGVFSLLIPHNELPAGTRVN